MKIAHWLRVIHRDLGFLVVGVTLVYGISGIFLNHMKEKDPAFRTEEKSVHFPARLTPEALTVAWKADRSLPPLKKIFPIDETHSRLMLEGGVGVYNSADGQVDYERHKKRVFIYWINRLHYNKVGHWHPVA
ncbi:MAG: peptidase, partial [Candidatus Symbiothrix sp.]|nr:peptidase [Candidatus Symbiothrix sp.]